VENSSRCHLNSDGEKVSVASPALISRKLAMLNRKASTGVLIANRDASQMSSGAVTLVPVVRNSRTCVISSARISRSAIAGRKIRNIGQCMSSDVTKGSRFLQTGTMTRPGNEFRGCHAVTCSSRVQFLQIMTC
jgi:hypothetical protein